MIYTLGIDPGLDTGFGLWGNSQLQWKKLVENHNTQIRKEVVEEIAEITKDSKVIVQCEDQFLGGKTVKDQVNRFHRIKVVSNISSFWEEQLRLKGFIVLPRIQHQTWKATFKMNGCKNVKDVGLKLVQNWIDPTVNNDNVSDGSLIGLHEHLKRLYKNNIYYSKLMWVMNLSKPTSKQHKLAFGKYYAKGQNNKKKR